MFSSSTTIMKINFLQIIKTFVAILILFFALSFSNNAKGGTLLGCDLSYECTSTPGVYKVKMKLFRACNDVTICIGCSENPIPYGNTTGCTTANAGWTTQITGLSAGYVGVNYGSFVLNAVSSTSGYDILQTCSSVATICSNCNIRTAGTFSPGIEVFNFEGNVSLNSIPALCCNVAFTASTCCRSASSTTIYPDSYFSIAELNRCQTTCNSAPTFTNEAIVLACAGNDFVYNLGAIDIDNDSLSYAFGTSYKALNTSVTYLPPYSASYPFPYYGAPNANTAYPAGLRIDPITGDILFRPIGLFLTCMVIEVTQWKLVNGTRVNVGKTRRDVQFQTVSCSVNKLPLIKVYNKGVLQTNNIIAFARQQICLNIAAEDQRIIANDPLTADTTDLTWNNASAINPFMASATFTRNYILANRVSNGPKADSFKFCWTPATNAIRQLPHMFTVTGSDRFCPLKAFATKGISLIVQNPFVNIESSTKNVFCNNKTTSTNINYKVNGIDLLSNNVFTVQLSDSFGSFANATTLATSISTLLTGAITVNIPQGLAVNKPYAIRVLCSSDNLCDNIVYSITVVQGFQQPAISTNRNSFCKGLYATIAVTPTYAGLSYKWYKNNVLLTNVTGSSFLTDSNSNYKVLVSNAGCADTSNSLALVVNSKPIAAFACPDTLCKSEYYNFVVITNNSYIDSGTISSYWAFSDGTTDIAANPVKTLLNNNNLNIKLLITSNNNCIDSLSKTVVINQKPIISFSVNDSVQCFKNNQFIFSKSITNSNLFSWNFGDSSSSNLSNPTKIYSKTGSFLVRLFAQNNNGCSDSMFKTITINTNAIADFNINNAVQCLSKNSFTFNNTSTNSNAQTWSFGDASSSIVFNPIKTYLSAGNFTVKLVANNANNCKDSVTKTITIYPQPTIGTITGNAVPNSISTSFSYSVLSQSNTIYNWFTANGNIQNGQGTNSVNIIWTSIGSASLKANITNSNGCTDSTSLAINISNVGINNLSLENDLKVFPNPTESFITITNKNNMIGKKYIITNLVGQTVLSGKLNVDETIVNLETLQSGMYFLSMDGISKQSIKIVKQ